MKRCTLYVFIITFSLSGLNAQTLADKNKVQEFFQNQQFEEAIEYLIPFYQTDSTNIPVLNYLGYANYTLDNTRLAKNFYQKTLNIDTNNLIANTYMGILTSNRYPAEAQVFYNRLIKLEPGKASHYRNTGELWSRKNQPDSAFFYLDYAYTLAPKDYRNATALADLLIDKTEFAKADSIVETGLIADSLNVYYLKLRLRSAYEAKDYQNALVPGERLLRLEETSLTALSQLVLSYYNLKMYTDCIRVCEYVRERELMSEAICFYEAKSYAKIKDFAKSNELLQDCIAYAISKNAELYYYTMGENYEAQKKYKPAVAQYDTAYYLFRDPLQLYNGGRVLETGLNNIDLSKKYYKKYLSLATPKTPEEKKAYQYVKDKLEKKSVAP
jgi:tetratricopeptide (TPR) repeat protein